VVWRPDGVANRFSLVRAGAHNTAKRQPPQNRQELRAASPAGKALPLHFRVAPLKPIAVAQNPMNRMNCKPEALRQWLHQQRPY
jgi:hypothetical protein